MNRGTTHTSVKRDLVLGGVIMILLVALFFAFSRVNQSRITIRTRAMCRITPGRPSGG